MTTTPNYFSLEGLNKLYDDNLHPQVMKLVNALGLGDKPADPSDASTWRTVATPSGGTITKQMVPHAQDDFFKGVGKGTLVALGAGALGGGLVSLGKRPVGLASNSGLSVPLTEEEQQALLLDRKAHKRRRKFGEVKFAANPDRVFTQKES